MRMSVLFVVALAATLPAFARPGDGDDFSEPSSGSSSSDFGSSSGSSSSDWGSSSSYSSPSSSYEFSPSGGSHSSYHSSGPSSPFERFVTNVLAVGFLSVVTAQFWLPIAVAVGAGTVWKASRWLGTERIHVECEGRDGVCVEIAGRESFNVYADEPAVVLVDRGNTVVSASPLVLGIVEPRLVNVQKGTRLKVCADGRVWYEDLRGWVEAPVMARAPQRRFALPPPPADPYAALCRRDPRFDVAGFERLVQASVNGVYRAWNAGRAEDLRPWTSDGVYNRFATQIAIHAAAGIRNESRSLVIERLRTLSCTLGTAHDAIDVELRMSAVDVDVDLATGQPASPPGDADSFTEIWTFVRSAGAVTKPGGGCPSCAAPLGDGAVIRCPSCTALVNTGAARWVLTEITQPKARLPKPVLKLPTGVSAAVIEDRASLCFWAWVAAGTDLNGTLKVLATPDFVFTTEAYDKVGVGAVVLRRVAADGPALIAYVNVRWTGTSRATGQRSTQTWSLALRREAGAAPDARGLATLACPACAGPCGRTDEPTCGWCGAARGPSPTDWVLVGLER